MSELLPNIVEMIRPLDEAAMAQARARQNQGKVLSVGPFVKENIKVGDKVAFLSHPADIVGFDMHSDPSNKQDIVSIEESKVLAIL